MHNMLCTQYLQICGRVLMASERVLVSRLCVLMSRPPVRVASQQVLIGYEPCQKPGFFPVFLRRLPLRSLYH